MKKLLLLTAVAMLTVSSAVGCRGGLGCLRRGDRCDQCDTCSHPCSASTQIMSEGPETLMPSPAPVRRSRNVLPGPVEGSTSG